MIICQEINDHPHFVIDGFQRQDIGQGRVGNCWFVAAAGKLFSQDYPIIPLLLF
jgi:hypothetical protein